MKYLMKPTANELFGQEFKKAPDGLLNMVCKRLRVSLRAKRFPEKGVSEAIKSFHFGNIPKPINVYFLEKFEIEKEDLELTLDWPIDWKAYRGRIAFAAFRTGEKLSVEEWKRVNKKYFYFW